jgi:DNA modification methylase
VTRRGDLWLLGEHRLICGDSRERAVYDALMGAEAADLVFTDPPYNVKIGGNVCGLGAIQHEEFAFASGEMSEAEFIAFLAAFLTETKRVSVDGATLFVCMDWKHIHEVTVAARQTDLDIRNLCVWVKDNGGMGSFYRSKHELVFVFKVGTAPHTNSFGLGDTGRYRTNVWDYAGVNTMKAGRMDELAMHPTVKPVALVADAIRDCSKRGETVLDCFAGSGTTLIAAEKCGRRARLVEFDGAYCDRIVARFESFTGKQARLEESGQSFEDAAAKRAEVASLVAPAEELA